MINSGFKKGFTMNTLTELKNNQTQLRSSLLNYYQSGNKSIKTLATEIKIPYTTFRGFMLGNNVGYLNLIKIKNWLHSLESSNTACTP